MLLVVRDVGRIQPHNIYKNIYKCSLGFYVENPQPTSFLPKESNGSLLDCDRGNK